MANYLYNGVELSALPQWDRKTYPHGTLYYLVSKNQYIFYATAVPGVYGTPADTIVTGYNKVVQFGSSSSEPKIKGTLTDGVWEYKDGSGLYIAIDKTNGTVLAEIVWANYDILDRNGAVYLNASYPIDAVTGAEIHDYDPNAPTDEPTPLDPKSTLMGWLVGRRIAGQRGKRSPVAYLYNGVRLPALPEWDKTTYPYAEIIFTQGGKYIISINSMAMYVKGEQGFYPSGNKRRVSTYDGTTWGAFGNESSVAGEGNPYVLPLWANHNVLYEDGAVYLAASEPIPVYE